MSPPYTDNQRQRLIDAVVQPVLAQDPEFDHLWQHAEHPQDVGQADYVFAVEDEPHRPDDVFFKVRWGGQFVYVARSRAAVAEAAERFAERGFRVTQPPAYIRQKFLGIPFLGRKLHYFAARRVLLVPPRQFSDRFTYHVELVPPTEIDEGYSVLKQVPTPERVAARLRARFPDIGEELLQRRVRKFTQKIFPLFLTREAAMLNILQRDLPAKYAGRVPRVLEVRQDDRGFVTSMRMNWLRNGGRRLSQVEFAQQAAELLHVLHDTVGVIHLDLRLDNMVVTERGVGFVDFGSSVRVGENLGENPLLETIFDELMRTSEIQRMLEHMTLSGKVTSPALSSGLQRVDKSVDVFYLALQINEPLNNPDFEGLVKFDPHSAEARALRRMSQEVLRPKNVDHLRYRTAGDVLRGIQLIAEKKDAGRLEADLAAVDDDVASAVR